MVKFVQAAEGHDIHLIEIIQINKTRMAFGKYSRTRKAWTNSMPFVACRDYFSDLLWCAAGDRDPYKIYGFDITPRMYPSKSAKLTNIIISVQDFDIALLERHTELLNDFLKECDLPEIKIKHLEGGVNGTNIFLAQSSKWWMCNITVFHIFTLLTKAVFCNTLLATKAYEEKGNMFLQYVAQSKIGNNLTQEGMYMACAGVPEFMAIAKRLKRAVKEWNNENGVCGWNTYTITDAAEEYNARPDTVHNYSGFQSLTDLCNTLRKYSQYLERHPEDPTGLHWGGPTISYYMRRLKANAFMRTITNMILEEEYALPRL
jgi:hypothetical protein